MRVWCVRLMVKRVVRRDFHACCNSPQDMDRTKQDLYMNAKMFKIQCWYFCESFLKVLRPISPINSTLKSRSALLAEHCLLECHISIIGKKNEGLHRSALQYLVAKVVHDSEEQREHEITVWFHSCPKQKSVPAIVGVCHGYLGDEMNKEEMMEMKRDGLSFQKLFGIFILSSERRHHVRHSPGTSACG